MQTQSNKIDFKGQNIYAGIKGWVFGLIPGGNPLLLKENARNDLHPRRGCIISAFGVTVKKLNCAKMPWVAIMHSLREFWDWSNHPGYNNGFPPEISWSIVKI